MAEKDPSITPEQVDLVLERIHPMMQGMINDVLSVLYRENVIEEVISVTLDRDGSWIAHTSKGDIQKPKQTVQ